MYKTDYKDYSKYIAIMISTDRLIFSEKSAVRARMMEQSKMYKELHIIVFSKQKHNIEKISVNGTIYSTNSFSKIGFIFDAYKIAKKIIKNINKEIPILITCQDIFATAIVGRFLLRLRKGIELLLQIHGDIFSENFAKHSFLNKIIIFGSRFTLPYADNIRVVSNKIADSLVKKGIDKDKIILKPIYVDTDFLRNSIPKFDLHQKFNQFSKIIIMVSRLESEKNIDGALRAFALVLNKIPKAGLVIVGSGGELAKLKKLSYNLGIQNSVIFEGWQTDLISYYKTCDLLLVTSWYEGYGMILKEAESVGCKIVSTDVGIAREVKADIVDWKYESIAEKIIENIK